MNMIEIGIGIFLASLGIIMVAFTIFLLKICWNLWRDINAD